MRGAFSDIILKKMEENPIIKKAIIRVFALCLSIGLIFSAISFHFFQKQLIKPQSGFLLFVTCIIIAFLIGGVCGLLVCGNILVHIKKIIQELSHDKPRWEWLEREYIESDIRPAYEAIKKLHTDVSSQAKLVCVAKIATQVAHDIRSPLVGLDLIIKEISHIPEDQRILIRNATNRIYDIANNLLSQYKSPTIGSNYPSNTNSCELISELVLDTIFEKKNQYKNLPIEFITQIDEPSKTLFVNLSSSSFKRAISNLLDNSVEAFIKKNSGIITIDLISQENTILLSIKDNGCGISQDLLQNLMLGEVVSQKKNGNGIGLAYAIKMIEDECGGQFSMQSRLDEGTKVDICLKITKAPNWFISELPIFNKMTIVILDDDETIHEIWRNRLNNLPAVISFIDFYNPEDLISWHKQNQLIEPILFLLDFKLIGYDKTGLDVINLLNIVQNSYLVTSIYDDMLLREQCDKLGLGIIPKKFALTIPIHIMNYTKIADLIFIDDNDSLTDAWVLYGNSVGKKIDVFNKISHLKTAITTYKRDIPIYIDCDLNDYLSGPELGNQLYEQGFVNLYLSTGYPANHFKEMPWFKGIIGKEPPF